MAGRSAKAARARRWRPPVPGYRPRTPRHLQTATSPPALRRSSWAVEPIGLAQRQMTAREIAMEDENDGNQGETED